MRFVILIIFWWYSCGIIVSQDIKPVIIAKTDALISDIIVKDNNVIVVGESGKIQKFDLQTRKLLNEVSFPLIKDFMGDEVPAKIYSVDRFDDSGILTVSQGYKGFRNVYLTKAGFSDKIIDAENSKWMIKEARFVSNSTIILGLLSNEIILYDIELKEVKYKYQVNHSPFSDLALNEKRTRCAIADESGIIKIISVSTGLVEKEMSGSNVDNIYQLDYKNEILCGGGQDRRLSFYSVDGVLSGFIQSDFLIYSVGLNPSGEIIAYLANEDNEINIFELSSRKIIATLKGHNGVITKIFFTDERKLISVAEDGQVLMWKF